MDNTNSHSVLWIDQNVDWSNVDNARRISEFGEWWYSIRGGYSINQVWSATDWSKHPRTAVGVDGMVITMVTVDGRTSRGDGMTTPELGQLMSDLGSGCD